MIFEQNHLKRGIAFGIGEISMKYRNDTLQDADMAKVNKVF